jgi:hypothetical protein
MIRENMAATLSVAGLSHIPTREHVGNNMGSNIEMSISESCLELVPQLKRFIKNTKAKNILHGVGCIVQITLVHAASLEWYFCSQK